jgi:hypothetical protein
MQATTTDGANRLFANKKYVSEDWYTIINSAGGTSGIASTASDTVWFSSEYYIDDVNFKSIVGSNNLSKASIVVELEFQITEPHGIDFIRELWNFNTNKLLVNNYLETCYLLSIEWKGFLDDGSLQSLNAQDQIKYIPMRIASIDVQLTSTGSVYSVKAIPYNTINSTQLFGYVPDNVTIQGQTLEQLISEQLAPKINEKLVQSARENYKTENPQPSVQYVFNFVQKTINGKSIDIGKFKLSSEEDINAANAALPAVLDKKTQNEIAKNMKSFELLNQPIPKGQQVPFAGKEQILEAITQLIIMSEYVTNQIKEFKQAYNDVVSANQGKSAVELAKIIQNTSSLNKPINWFKILPKVTAIEDWNEYTNMYNKVIQLDIVPYIIYDSRNANNIIGGSKPTEDKVVKEYFYFFTGKNTEVINCDIKFNTLYYNNLQSNKSTIDQASGAKPVEKPKDPAVRPQDPASGASDPLTAGSVSGTPSTPTRPMVNVGKFTPERSKAAQFSSILYSSVDLVMVDLEIMGDPDLIMQDTIIYDLSKMETDQQDPAYTGSISMTDEEKFMRLTFVSPKDIDLGTGLLKKENKSIFDGLYRLATVQSVFKQGKFTQTLQLMKVAMVDPAISQDERIQLPDPPVLPNTPSIPISDIPILPGLGDLSNLPAPPV